MTTFFTSDLHLGHENIRALAGRPFPSTEIMNRTIIDNWNSRVTGDDMVFLLGDVFMGKIAETMPLGAELNGQIFLIPGNHDRCWHGNWKRDKTTGQIKPASVDAVRDWANKYHDIAGFEVMEPEVRLFTHTGPIFDMCHFPPAGDSHDEDRYVDFRPPVSPYWNLHGHTHSHDLPRKGNAIHVGVDAWDYYPVSVEEINGLL